MLDIRCKRLHEAATLPMRNEGNIGWDLSVVRDPSFRELPMSGCGPNCTQYEFTRALMPGEFHIFHTGLSIAVPPGYGALLWDRSGMGAKKQIHRLAGVIDENYRGEWLIALINHSHGVQRITEGDRIIQFVLQKNYEAQALWVEELDETNRGDKGFGSSGN